MMEGLVLAFLVVLQNLIIKPYYKPFHNQHSRCRYWSAEDEGACSNGEGKGCLREGQRNLSPEPRPIFIWEYGWIWTYGSYGNFMDYC